MQEHGPQYPGDARDEYHREDLHHFFGNSLEHVASPLGLETDPVSSLELVLFFEHRQRAIRDDRAERFDAPPHKSEGEHRGARDRLEEAGVFVILHLDLVRLRLRGIDHAHEKSGGGVDGEANCDPEQCFDQARVFAFLVRWSDQLAPLALCMRKRCHDCLHSGSWPKSGFGTFAV